MQLMLYCCLFIDLLSHWFSLLIEKRSRSMYTTGLCVVWSNARLSSQTFNAASCSASWTLGTIRDEAGVHDVLWCGVFSYTSHVPYSSPWLLTWRPFMWDVCWYGCVQFHFLSEYLLLDTCVFSAIVVLTVLQWTCCKSDTSICFCDTVRWYGIRWWIRVFQCWEWLGGRRREYLGAVHIVWGGSGASTVLSMSGACLKGWKMHKHWVLRFLISVHWW